MKIGKEPFFEKYEKNIDKNGKIRINFQKNYERFYDIIKNKRENRSNKKGEEKMQLSKEGTEEDISKMTFTEIGRIACGVGKEEIVYQLFRNGLESDVFRISVSSGDESETGMLYGTLSGVTDIFERIARGKVRPYILPEILEDWTDDMDSCRNQGGKTGW